MLSNCCIFSFACCIMTHFYHRIACSEISPCCQLLKFWCQSCILLDQTTSFLLILSYICIAWLNMLRVETIRNGCWCWIYLISLRVNWLINYRIRSLEPTLVNYIWSFNGTITFYRSSVSSCINNLIIISLISLEDISSNIIWLNSSRNLAFLSTIIGAHLKRK